MSNNGLKFTTHEGVTKVVPLDTIRLIKPMTEEDKARATAALKDKKGIDIDAARVNIRIEFGDKSSKLAQENLEALREQGIALVNLGSERYAPAANITGAEAFTKEDADRLKEMNTRSRKPSVRRLRRGQGPSSLRRRRYRLWIVAPRQWKPCRQTAIVSQWRSLHEQDSHARTKSSDPVRRA